MKFEIVDIINERSQSHRFGEVTEVTVVFKPKEGPYPGPLQVRVYPKALEDNKDGTLYYEMKRVYDKYVKEQNRPKPFKVGDIVEGGEHEEVLNSRL